MRNDVASLVLAAAVLAGAGCGTTAAADQTAGRADHVTQARPLAEVLQGCSVEDDGTRMRCGGVSVVVHDGAWETTFEQRAQQQAEDVLAKAVFDEVVIDVLGRTERLRRARIAAVYGDSHLTTVLFAQGSGGRARERSYTCDAPADVEGAAERCVEILASYLAESPSLSPPVVATTDAPKDGVARAAGVAFGARIVPLLPGCRVVSAPPGGRLDCRAAVVVWRPFKTMKEATAAALDAVAPYQGIGNAEVSEDVACRIAGEAARCSQASVDGAEPLVVVVGVAYVDGTPMAATCRATVQTVDATVCGGLISIDP